MNDRADRALGAFFGLAVGDAVGTTLEFAERDRQPPLTDMVGGGPFRLPPGGWTDDTSMALALADSLAERGGLDAGDVMRRWLRWWRQGAYSHNGRCFDIGIQTRAALAGFERSGALPDPTESAGNGAIMRLAPVVLFALDAGAEEAARLAAAQARLTHNNNEDADTTAAVAGQIAGALYGLSGIPPRWLARLLWRAEIEALARRLLPAEA